MKLVFQKLLLEIAPLEPSAQKAKLAEAFLTWKGEHEQTDDVLVAGFRI